MGKLRLRETNAPCEKCGSHNVRRDYRTHSMQRIPHIFNYETQTRLVAMYPQGPQIDHEYLHCECDNCHFFWPARVKEDGGD